jgi:hypothetical protein
MQLLHFIYANMRNKTADLSITRWKFSLNALPISMLYFIVEEYYRRMSPVPDNEGQTSVSSLLSVQIKKF